MRINDRAHDNDLPAALAELVVLGPPPKVARRRRREPWEGAPVPTETLVPLREIAVSGSLAGAVARLRMEHRFELPPDPEGAPIDARYRFPVPRETAVRGVTMRFGDEEVRAELRERPEARDAFEEGRQTGRAAVLVTDSGAGVLTLEVTGIAPGIPLVTCVELVALPRPEADGSAVLRIPLTAAPRYTRGDEDPAAWESSPAGSAAQVPFGVRLELQLSGDAEISSTSHALDVVPDGDRRMVRFGGEVTPDRDLVLVVRPRGSTEARGLVVLGETRDGRTPWLAQVVAPERASMRIPRSLVLLVDRSGSMGGGKWDAAEWAVRSLVAGCDEDDSVLVLCFDDRLERSSAGLVRMDEEARRRVTGWLGGIEPRGGTELGASLEEALRSRPRRGTQAELLVVTDGQVSDAARILSLVDDTPWRVSVLCIDSAPNADLVTSLADRGGGDSWFLTSAGGEDITDAVDRVTAFFATPSVADLRLRVGGRGRAVGRRGRQERSGLVVPLGALPAGSVRLVCGVAEGEPGAFRLEGGASADLEVLAEREPGVGTVAAASEIQRLEQAWRLALGRAPEQAREEAARAGIPSHALPRSDGLYEPIPGSFSADPLADALRALVIERSLATGVASSQTAFVGVRRTAGKVSHEQIDVPSVLPAGWDGAFAAPGVVRALAFAPLPGDVGTLRSSSPRLHSRALIAFDAPRVDGPLADTASPAARSVELRLKVADLVGGGTVLPAPAGTWRAIRVRGAVGDASGARLLIWEHDRTRPLLRARLADLLAAGERPARLRFQAGASFGIAIEGGALKDGELVLELVGWSDGSDTQLAHPWSTMSG
jgi:Mg-chelatase subunit ChlD